MANATPDTITLYYAPRSRSFSALWLLEELGVDYRLESFDLESGRHKQPDYLALNPMGKVPLVMDGDIAVSELGAMAIHLPERIPDANLAPPALNPARPAFLRWVFFASAIMEPAFGQKMFDWHIPPRNAAWGSFEQMFEILTETLGANTWLMGDDFTSADVLVGANLMVGQLFGVIPKDSAVDAYVARLRERAAYLRASAIDTGENERFPLKT